MYDLRFTMYDLRFSSSCIPFHLTTKTQFGSSCIRLTETLPIFTIDDFTCHAIHLLNHRGTVCSFHPCSIDDVRTFSLELKVYVSRFSSVQKITKTEFFLHQDFRMQLVIFIDTHSNVTNCGKTLVKKPNFIVFLCF